MKCNSSFGLRSGMGKTAVFVLACLQQLDASEKACGSEGESHVDFSLPAARLHAGPGLHATEMGGRSSRCWSFATPVSWPTRSSTSSIASPSGPTKSVVVQLLSSHQASNISLRRYFQDVKTGVVYGGMPIAKAPLQGISNPSESTCEQCPLWILRRQSRGQTVLTSHRHPSC